MFLNSGKNKTERPTAWFCFKMWMGKLEIDSFYTVEIGLALRLCFTLVLLEEALGFLGMNCCSTQSALHTKLPSVYTVASVNSLYNCSGALNNLNNLSVGQSPHFYAQLLYYCTLLLLMSPLSVSLSTLILEMWGEGWNRYNFPQI